MFCDVLRCSAMFCDVLRCSAMFCDVLRCSAMFCDVLRCSAMFCDGPALLYHVTWLVYCQISKGFTDSTWVGCKAGEMSPKKEFFTHFIYYPPEESSMKYCMLLVLRLE